MTEDIVETVVRLGLLNDDQPSLVSIRFIQKFRFKAAGAMV
jgi:hypothetical protein